MTLITDPQGVASDKVPSLKETLFRGKLYLLGITQTNHQVGQLQT